MRISISTKKTFLSSQTRPSCQPSCAPLLPGRNFAVLQDFQDDQEHSAGRHLLKLLVDADIYNRAVFVVRYYGGEHLGPSHFNAFVEAAQSAITHDPYNHVTKSNQTPWPKQSIGTTETSTADNAIPVLTSEESGNPSGTTKANGIAAMTPEVVAGTSEEMTTQKHGLRGQPSARGWMPSGPTRPIYDKYNPHQPVSKDWDTYYEEERYKLNWHEAAATESTGELQQVVKNIQSLSGTNQAGINTSQNITSVI